eukprot:Blabericola_migrator_1__5035@NODE_260_length_10712_cov_94_884922_g218_i0_p3_GENE_NODE_260_length_10712_cov_94_884922_g218_i0NODE_260_length_10712_cov_94_884922_g218_i0_p3_ORF_typecomplete_len506_score77_63Gly_kinase/PF02595_15/1_3e95_NODE_260_length_10712_cov_94_884922_g218_i03891906
MGEFHLLRGYQHRSAEGGFIAYRRTPRVGRSPLTRGAGGSKRDDDSQGNSPHISSPPILSRALSHPPVSHTEELSPYISSESRAEAVRDGLIYGARNGSQSRATSASCLNRLLPCLGAGRSGGPLSVVVAMDSFKGVMTSTRAAAVTEEALRSVGVTRIYTQVTSDGGEGFLDAFAAAYGVAAERVPVPNVLGPDHYPKTVELLYNRSARIAVIESALAIGHSPTHQHPDKYSSYGVGQLILAALDLGAKVVYVGIGGTCTVDGGTGLAQALGVRFTSDASVIEHTNPLLYVDTVDTRRLDPRLKTVQVIAAVDVDCPLLGPTGAVSMFGPQKGLTGDEIGRYEGWMKHLARLVEETCSCHGLSDRAGTGAGGGLSYILAAFLLSPLESGFEALISATELRARIQQADLVITGEGRFDAQSLHGKLPIQVGRIAKATDTKVFLMAGQVVGDIVEVPEEGITCVIPLSEKESEGYVPSPPEAEARLAMAVQRSVALARAGRNLTLK